MRLSTLHYLFAMTPKAKVHFFHQEK